MTKCSECGYENMDGLDYCDGCGAKLAHSAEGAPAPGAEPAPAAAAAAAPAEPEPEPAPAAAAAPEPAPAAAEAPAAEAPAAEAPTGELNKPAAAPEPAPAMQAAFKAKLVLVRGDKDARKGFEFPLEEGKNLIGRWDPETGSFPEVDLEQDDREAKISRKHAMIINENGKLTIEDIGSLNGTYVNRGNRLIPGTPVDLKTGDEIIIGKTFLKLVVDPIS